MDEILKYFPALSDLQREQLAQLGELYPQWNDKINVVSRKDIDNLYVNHVLHSLSIAKFITFAPGSNILDLGTGGGFPGIPLAILFPDSQFLLVDRIGKKLTVASDIAAKTGVRNVATFHGDIKEVKGEFDFVVSRAVMPAAPLFSLSRRLICRKNINSMRNGLIMLKGGDLTEELGELKRINLFVQDLSLYFTEPFFDTKKIVYIPV